MNRRSLLKQLGGGFGLLGTASVLAAADSSRSAIYSAGKSPHFPAKAKRVIHLFMNGGPFQGDLFDPKPALVKYAGQKPEGADLLTERPTGGLLPSPFKFQPSGQSGVPVSELLPLLSQHVDDICVLRSLHADNPNHGPALLQMNNGTITPTRPSMGAWFLYGLGTENANLPGYIVLCPGRPVRFSILWNSAFLPSAHQGTYINHSQINPDKMIPHLRNAQWDKTTQREQLDLLRQLNAEYQSDHPGDSVFEARMESMETAFRMQFEASDAFDVNRETKATRAGLWGGTFRATAVCSPGDWWSAASASSNCTTATASLGTRTPGTTRPCEPCARTSTSRLRHSWAI